MPGTKSAIDLEKRRMDLAYYLWISDRQLYCYTKDEIEDAITFLYCIGLKPEQDRDIIYE